MSKKLSRVPASVLLALASAALGCFVFTLFFFSSGGAVSKAEQPPVKPVPTLQLSDDALGAKAAILYDPTTGKVLYEKNSQLTLPLASLTKLLTAHTVLHSMPTSTLVSVSKKDTLGGSDAGDWGLKIGDVLRLGDLIKIGLAASSNYAMSAAAGSLGSTYVTDMNRDANQLGLSHTYFLNPTGLDVNTALSGGYGSADDVAHLAAVFLKEYPQYFELSAKPTVSVEASGRSVTASATAVPLQDIPGFIGAKTGYTDLAGGNLVMAYDIDIGHPLIAVVLGSTKDGRFTDMRTLVDASRAFMSTQHI